MTDLDRAVQTVVRRCLNIQPDEDVVVVVDEPLQDLGEKLRTASQQTTLTGQGDEQLAVEIMKAGG